MKPLFIAASLLANVGLIVALALRPSLAPAAVREFIGRHVTFTGATVNPSANARRAPADARRAVSGSTPPRLLGPAFETDDVLVLQARLRAAGFPADVIVEIGRREIDARYDAKVHALTDLDPATPFWKTSPEALAAAGRRNERVSQIFRERDKAYRDFVNGPEFFTVAALDIGQRRMWGDLSREKLDRIQRIDDDYTDMMSTVRSTANGVLLAADRAQLELLEREKQADIMATLSPAELAEYKFRTTATSLGLNARFPNLVLNEAEFRTIAQAQLDLSSKYTFNNGAPTLDPEQARLAQQAFESQVKNGIGEARYADYLRNTNGDYQQLSRLAEVDRVPVSAVNQAFGVRERAAQESNRIFDDASLDPAQKAAALQTLAQNARTQITALLGPTSGPAYVKVAEAWLSNLERGAAVTFNASSVVNIGNNRVLATGGGSTTYRRLPGFQPPAQPSGPFILRGP